MNFPNFELPQFMQRKEEVEDVEYDDSVSFLSPITVRQNIAAETTVNLNFSLKYNKISLILSVSKIMATVGVFLSLQEFCFGARQIWLFMMLCYDLFNTRIIIITIQNIFEMNSVIASHEPVLNFNIHNKSGNNNKKKNYQININLDDVYDHDEVREYDVEQSHRTTRISSLSPKAKKGRQIIANLIRMGNGMYILLFVFGHLLYLFTDGSRETATINQLIKIYLILGWIWVLHPFFLLIVGCFFLPLSLLWAYFFVKGTRIPKSKINTKKLSVQTYVDGIPGDKECAICMLEYHEGDKIIELNCNSGHYFHETCLKRWLKVNGQCPVCKTKVELSNRTSNRNEEERLLKAQDETNISINLDGEL